MIQSASGPAPVGRANVIREKPLILMQKAGLWRRSRRIVTVGRLPARDGVVRLGRLVPTQR
jgi:hypothetical protein